MEVSPQSLSPQQEKKIIQDIFQGIKKMKAGDIYYVIESKWWGLWKDYVKYDEEDTPDTVYGQKPDKIDNEGLMELENEEKPKPPEVTETRILSNSATIIETDQGKDKQEKEAPKQEQPSSPDANQTAAKSEPKKVLRKNLAKGFDFDVVPEKAWSHLYGGGPEIPRKVITIGIHLTPIVELHPVSLHAVGSNPHPYCDHDHWFLFSRFVKVKEVTRNLASHWLMPPHKCSVFLFEDSNHVSPLDPLKTLEELGLVDGQVLFIKTTQEPLSAEDFDRRGYSHSSYSAPFVRRETNREGTPVATGVVGLNNLGNTCFMNSVVQCLSNTKPLREYFMTDAYTKDLNLENALGTKGNLAKEFHNLMKLMWSNKYLSVIPSDFKRAVGNFAPQFNGYSQHDAQELMAFLLDGLHEDTNKQGKAAPKKEAAQPSDPTTTVVPGESQQQQTSNPGKQEPSQMAVDETPTKKEEKTEQKQEEMELPSDQSAWKSHQSRNESFVVDLFHGQLKSNLACDICHSHFVTYDPFVYLSLPIPTTNQRVIPITYFPRSGRPRRYGISVPKLSEVRDLKSALAQAVHVSPEELFLADVYSNKAFKIPDYKYLFDVRKEDVIFAFQVFPPKPPSAVAITEEEVEPAPAQAIPEPESPHPAVVMGGPTDMDLDEPAVYGPQMSADHSPHSQMEGGAAGGGMAPHSKNSTKKEPDTGIWNFQLFQRKVTIMSATSVKADIIGFPLILSCEKTSTNAVLFKEVLERVKNFVGYDSIVPLDLSQFRIVIVNGSGRGCGVCPPAKQCLGCPLADMETRITLNNSHCLAVDWPAHTANILFDEKREKEFVELDESMQLVEQAKEEKHVTLDDCLKLFCKEEKLTLENRWFCPKCQKYTQAEKKIEIWKMPEILVVHLKRFLFTHAFRDKLTEKVDFPLTEVDFQPFLSNANSSDTKYSLYAVSNHMGGLSSGHYICYSKHENGTWYEYNDSSCSVVEKPEEAISKYGYILFFRKTSQTNYPFLDEYIAKFLQDLEKEKELAAKESENKSDTQMTSPPQTTDSNPAQPGTTAPKEERKDTQGTSKQEMSQEEADLVAKHWQEEYRPENLQLVEHESPHHEGVSRAKRTHSGAPAAAFGVTQRCPYCDAPIVGTEEEVQIHWLTECKVYNDSVLGNDGYERM